MVALYFLSVFYVFIHSFIHSFICSLLPLYAITFRQFDYEIIIVEDNSPDGTLAIANKLQDVYGRNKIVVLSRPGKLGLGSAYIDGLKLCSGNYIFLMDADMSHHPKYITSFISKQSERDYDIVTATRYAQGGGVAGWDLKRVITSRGANLLATLLLNPTTTDLTGAREAIDLSLTVHCYNITHCYPVALLGSFRMYKRQVLEDLMLSVRGRAYVFQMEVVYRIVS